MRGARNRSTSPVWAVLVERAERRSLGVEDVTHDSGNRPPRASVSETSVGNGVGVERGRLVHLIAAQPLVTNESAVEPELEIVVDGDAGLRLTRRAAAATGLPPRALPRPIGPGRLRPIRTPCPMQHDRTTRDWLTQPTHPYIGACGRMAACPSSWVIVAVGLVEPTQPDQRGRFSTARSVYCVSRMHVAPRKLGSRGATSWSDEVRRARQWAWVELNYRPHAYQACALTT